MLTKIENSSRPVPLPQHVQISNLEVKLNSRLEIKKPIDYDSCINVLSSESHEPSSVHRL